MLFEVTGRDDLVFLVGEPTKLAHFIEDAEALERAICNIRAVAVLGGCKCSDPDPEPCPRSEELASGAGEAVYGTAVETAHATQPGPRDALIYSWRSKVTYCFREECTGHLWFGAHRCIGVYGLVSKRLDASIY